MAKRQLKTCFAKAEKWYKKNNKKVNYIGDFMWIIMAILAAVFAGLTTILAKIGIKNTDSDVATAIRTIVVLAFSWIMVFIVGSQGTIGQIEPKSMLFLVLSGLATGLSWIFYFKALSMAGIASSYLPISIYIVVIMKCA